ncbi:hypothetical protein HDU76_000687 [Blyttiomyces sp. JEL0837]|nr:hypothetical protein HDU76_000687 [Blyttiomyces sp. JEL0837]
MNEPIEDRDQRDMVIATHDYKSNQDTCLSFYKGDVINVHQRDASGWWMGTLRKRKGWFPSTYVEPYDPSQEKVQFPPPTPKSTVSSRTSGSHTHSYQQQQQQPHHRSATPIDRLDDLTDQLSDIIMNSAETDNPEADDLVDELVGAGGSVVVNRVRSKSPNRSSDGGSGSTGGVALPSGVRARSSSFGRGGTGTGTTGSVGRLGVGVGTSSSGVGSSHAVKPVETPALPQYWGMKTNSEGRVYYYNSQTNQTTYSFDDVKKAGTTIRRSTLLLKDANNVILPTTVLEVSSPAESPNITPTTANSTPTLKTINTAARRTNNRASIIALETNITWDLLLKNIMVAISHLNTATKESKTELYLELTHHIMRAIRDMLNACGTSSRDSPVMITNPVLKDLQGNILSSLSKLLVSAKVASGLWPPPDATQKVRYDAGQVLIAIRGFVEAGQSIKLSLHGDLLSPSSQTNNSGSMSVTDTLDVFGSKFSQVELVGKLDSYHDNIVKGISVLLGMIQRDKRVSVILIDQAKRIVTSSGELLSLVEDIKVVDPSVISTRTTTTAASASKPSANHEQLIKDFIRLKDHAFAVANDLVTAARTSMDEFAPANSLNLLIDSADSLTNAISDLVDISKELIDHQDLIEQQLLQYHAEGLSNAPSSRDSELSILQRRALSLSLIQTDAARSSMGSQGGSGSVSMAISARSDDHGSQLRPPSAHSTTSMQSMQSSGAGTSGYPGQQYPGMYQRRPSVPGMLDTPVSMASPNSTYSMPTTGGNTSQYPATYRRPSAPLVGQGGQPMAISGSYQGYQPSQQQQQQPAGYPISPFSPQTSSGVASIARSASMPGGVLGSGGVETERGEKWYLGHDCAPDSLSFNGDGRVNGGTFTSLVERMTLHDKPIDTEFFNTFLMMFHQFSTAADLINELFRRFFLVPPPTLTLQDLEIWKTRKLAPIQIRVSNVLKTWLESYWLEEEDSPHLTTLLTFSEGPLTQHHPNLAPHLTSLIKTKLLQLTTGPKGITTSPVPKQSVPIELSPPPQSIIPRVPLRKLTFGDVDPLEIARQISLHQSNIFCKIHWMELVGLQWNRQESGVVNGAPNVRAMTAFSTKLTSWAVKSILNEKDTRKRSGILKHYIKIADRMLTPNINNYDGMFAIISALNSSAVSRLRRTWEYLSDKNHNLFTDLKRLADPSKNYLNYRTRLRSTLPPSLPFLGQYLTDLTFIADGNPDKRPGTTNLINIDKYIKTYKIINEIQKFQMPFGLNEVPELNRWIIDSILTVGSTNQEVLYKISCELEPRVSAEEGEALEVQERLKGLMGY